MSEILSKIYIGFHAKLPLFLSDFNKHLILSTDFRKNTQVLNFMKIHSVGAVMFYADGRTDRHDEANARFSKFSERVYEVFFQITRLMHTSFIL